MWLQITPQGGAERLHFLGLSAQKKRAISPLCRDKKKEKQNQLGLLVPDLCGGLKPSNVQYGV